MWICKECKRSFDEPHEEREYHGCWPFYESFVYCPYCESADIDNVADNFEFDDKEGEEDV